MIALIVIAVILLAGFLAAGLATVNAGPRREFSDLVRPEPAAAADAELAG